MAVPPDFQLFSSTRYDPQTSEIHFQRLKPFYMLPYHQDRLIQAAEHFGWTKATDTIRDTKGFYHIVKKLTEIIDVKSPSPLRVKIILGYNGALTIEASSTPPVTIDNLYPARLPPPSTPVGSLARSDPLKDSPWDVLPDPGRTALSPFTKFKTSNRDMYNSARERVGIVDFAEKREVLIINEEGEVMEGSLTSVYFWREGQWVTPRVESGGQVGTTRRWALEKGFCVEAIVTVEELVEGEECWLSNGVRGLQLGKIKF